VAVVVVDEDSEYPVEMPSAEDQEPVEAFGASRPDEALGDGVGLWRAKGSADDLDHLASEDRVEVARELAIAVADQKTEWF
jgi:hypothetical protein